jgi:pimeloyl-ACP methyl ester carboxylesterase
LWPSLHTSRKGRAAVVGAYKPRGFYQRIGPLILLLTKGVGGSVARFAGLALMVAAMAILAKPVALLAAYETRFRSFDAKGVEIHFFVEGSGEPVVLIHGLYSSAEINWRMTGVVAKLAEHHQVIAFDLPGHGHSDRPENEDAYGLQIVEDIVLLLDHLKIDKAHIVGYSVGGMVALKFLAKHPGRSLSGTIGGMGWLRAGRPLQGFWDRMPAPEGRRTPPAFIQSVGKLAMTEEELKKIEVPVEVLIGDRDPVKRMYVVPLQQVRKDWPVVDIKDAGHISCIIKKQFREEIAAWVRKQEKR